MQITREQLVAIMPHAGQRVDTYLPLLNKFAEEFCGVCMLGNLSRLEVQLQSRVNRKYFTCLT